MSYAAPADMIELFGLAEVRQLAPLQGDPSYDAARLERFLADASAELDSYLATRFTVPVANAPQLLVRYTCDLAREGASRAPSDAVQEAAKRARAWGQAVARGQATLGTGPADRPETADGPSGGDIGVLAPDRVFDDAGLRGYLQ